MTVQQAFELAFQHHHAGRLGEAEALYRQILTAEPNHAGALHYLGLIAHQVGRHELAVELIGRTIALRPDDAAAHSNLGEAHRAMGSFAEAISAQQRALEIDGNLAGAHNNLGLALMATGRTGEAIIAYRRALEIKPSFAEAHLNLGNALLALGASEEAAQVYRQALDLKPDYAKVWNNLGYAYWEQGRLEEALASLRAALKLTPSDAEVHSNVVLALLYKPGTATTEVAEEQERWNRQCADPLKRFHRRHANDRRPDRRLRVGYVSRDFWNHVAGRNLIPLFDHHSRADFEIVCYSGVTQPDELTERFRARADTWRDIARAGDEDLANMIRQDGIDILVDLSQHTAGNRLSVFARRPAPVQVSFAGCPESTGLEAIEYRISDRWLEAADAAEMGNRRWQIGAPPPELRSSNSDLRPAERVYFLDSFWCYDPLGVEITTNDLPASGNGYVTFGSLCSSRKMNREILRLWARVLGRVRDSRLIVLCARGGRRRGIVDALAREGIEEWRVQFVEPSARSAYLGQYHQIDMVLDPFPYGGHTTSLEALWMGVPVVSLAGERPVSRGGLSISSHTGLAELVAFSEDDYVTIAEGLAGDLPRLAELRQTLRARMEGSVLMNASHFTWQIEVAYRAMWRRWCEANG